MTAAIRHLPQMKSRCARLVENAKAEAAAEDRLANLITARAVLNNPAMHRTQDVRNSIILLESRGDMRGDLIMADEATHYLAIRERREAHAAAKAAQRKTGAGIVLLGLGYFAALVVIVALRMAQLI